MGRAARRVAAAALGLAAPALVTALAPACSGAPAQVEPPVVVLSAGASAEPVASEPDAPPRATIRACDVYIDRFLGCIAPMADPGVQAEMRAAFEASRAAWRDAGRDDAVARRVLAETCRQLLATLEDGGCP